MNYLEYTVKIELCYDAMFRCLDCGSSMAKVWEAHAAKLKSKRGSL